MNFDAFGFAAFLDGKAAVHHQVPASFTFPEEECAALNGDVPKQQKFLLKWLRSLEIDLDTISLVWGTRFNLPPSPQGKLQSALTAYYPPTSPTDSPCYAVAWNAVLCWRGPASACSGGSQEAPGVAGEASAQAHIAPKLFITHHPARRKMSVCHLLQG
jgi:hypothetical protein